MQGRTDVGAGAMLVPPGKGAVDTEDDTIPSATSLVTPHTESFNRRWGKTRVSGIHIPRTSVGRICTCHCQAFDLD